MPRSIGPERLYKIILFLDAKKDSRGWSWDEEKEAGKVFLPRDILSHGIYDKDLVKILKEKGALKPSFRSQILVVEHLSGTLRLWIRGRPAFDLSPLDWKD